MSDDPHHRYLAGLIRHDPIQELQRQGSDGLAAETDRMMLDIISDVFTSRLFSSNITSALTSASTVTASARADRPLTEDDLVRALSKAGIDYAPGSDQTVILHGNSSPVIARITPDSHADSTATAKMYQAQAERLQHQLDALQNAHNKANAQVNELQKELRLTKATAQLLQERLDNLQTTKRRRMLTIRVPNTREDEA